MTHPTGSSREAYLEEYAELIAEIKHQTRLCTNEAIEILLLVEERVHVEQHESPTQSADDRRALLVMFYHMLNDLKEEFPGLDDLWAIRVLKLVERRIHCEHDLELINEFGNIGIGL